LFALVTVNKTFRNAVYTLQPSVIKEFCIKKWKSLPVAELYTEPIFPEHCNFSWLAKCFAVNLSSKKSINEINGLGYALVQKDFYLGNWVNGKLCGRGISYFAEEGLLFIGDYQDGFRNGVGVAFYKNADSYAGQWQNDKKEGYGIYIWKSKGIRYDGFFHEGQQKGTGRMIYATGDIYEGDWEDSKKNGRGIYQWKNGTRYVGEWKNGKSNGHGLIVYQPSGDCYEGDFKDDKRHGRGAYLSNRGTLVQGNWNMGVRVN